MCIQVSTKYIIIYFTVHSCTFPGCGKVLVLDGNVKNRRQVCNAKDAGFIQFDNHPGLIKTGCTATPAYKNRYCTSHMNQACTLQNVEVIDEELHESTGPTLRSKSPNASVGDPVAEMILGKKVTRKQIYYQVNISCVPIGKSSVKE